MRFTKHIGAENFNRKELVKALASNLGVSPIYNGMPTRSYTVGPYTIDFDGSIVGEDITPLRDFLIEHNYAKAEDFDAPAEISDATEIASDFENCMIIGMAVPDMTVTALKNLVFMLYTKQHLLNRAFGEHQLTVTEKLVTRLKEYTPESLSEFERILKDAWSVCGLEGFTYEDGDVKMAFPKDEQDPEKWVLYGDLLRKIVRFALNSTRIKPVIQMPEGERYYMHSWLIRLGCGGPDFKALRKLMLQNLNGYCAFPDEIRAQRHKDKCKEIRRIRREINEEADRR